MMTENLQNLEAERSEIVPQLHSPPEPEPDAKCLVDEADKLIAGHEQRIAELKDRRDQINNTFQVRQSEYDPARARERQEAHAEAIAGIHDAEARRLAAVQRLEEAVNAVAEAINAQNAAAEDVRRHARDLVRMAGIERISLLGLSQNDLTQRTAARLAAGRVESCLTRPMSLEARPWPRQRGPCRRRQVEPHLPAAVGELKRLAREDETEGARDAANVSFGRARADKL